MTRGIGRLARGWLLSHRVSRKRLLEILESERRARLGVPAAFLEKEAAIVRLSGERDDARAEAACAKSALEAARRERDHECRIAQDAIGLLRAVEESRDWWRGTANSRMNEIRQLKQTGSAAAS